MNKVIQRKSVLNVSLQCFIKYFSFIYVFIIFQYVTRQRFFFTNSEKE